MIISSEIENVEKVEKLDKVTRKKVRKAFFIRAFARKRAKKY